jgi:hypothetical protein
MSYTAWLGQEQIPAGGRAEAVELTSILSAERIRLHRHPTDRVTPTYARIAMVTTTRVPQSGWLVTRKVPPVSSIRSRIPCRPQWTEQCRHQVANISPHHSAYPS